LLGLRRNPSLPQFFFLSGTEIVDAHACFENG